MDKSPFVWYFIRSFFPFHTNFSFLCMFIFRQTSSWHSVKQTVKKKLSNDFFCPVSLQCLDVKHSILRFGLIRSQINIKKNQGVRIIALSFVTKTNLMLKGINFGWAETSHFKFLNERKKIFRQEPVLLLKGFELFSFHLVVVIWMQTLQKVDFFSSRI